MIAGLALCSCEECLASQARIEAAHRRHVEAVIAAEFGFQQLLAKGSNVKTYKCEYVENGAEVSLTGTLAELQRRVGSREVTLDGVQGHFELGEDESAGPSFVITKQLRAGGAW